LDMGWRHVSTYPGRGRGLGCGTIARIRDQSARSESMEYAGRWSDRTRQASRRPRRRRNWTSFVDSDRSRLSVLTVAVFQRYFVGRRIVRHMCEAGLLSKPKPSSGCLKLPDDVDEGFPAHHCVGVEGVNVVDGNHGRSHIPLVIPGALVRFLDAVVGLVIRPEIFDVHFRIRIADRLVREETELLVRADRPTYLLVDVGLDQLRAPVAVIALDEDCIGDIVQKAGENRFFRHGRLQSMGRALQAYG